MKDKYNQSYVQHWVRIFFSPSTSYIETDYFHVGSCFMIVRGKRCAKLTSIDQKFQH